MREPVPIERRLREVATQLNWPDDTDLAPAVMSELAGDRSRRSRGWILAVAAAAATLFLGLLVVPAGRQAIADLLGVAGIDIRLGSPSTVPISEDFDPGDASSLAEAAAAAAIPLLVPDGLGPPDVVFVDAGPPVMVTTGWEGDATLPSPRMAGMAILHTQFRANADQPLRKQLAASTSLQAVEVRGHDGWWIEGEPHRLEVTGDGSVGRWQVRLAGNVLMWEEGIVTHRIETTGHLDEVLRLADSLRPLPDD